jgi:PAS domain S-box-containing protein
MATQGRCAYASPVPTDRPKHLVHILAREFASNLATPTLIVDGEGIMIFFNEAAEELVGGTFAEVGEMTIDAFSDAFAPRHEGDDDPMPMEQRPTKIAFEERRAAHEEMTVTGLDGVVRRIGVTAFPLFAQKDEFVGIVAIWWRE